MGFARIPMLLFKWWWSPLDLHGHSKMLRLLVKVQNSCWVIFDYTFSQPVMVPVRSFLQEIAEKMCHPDFTP